MWTCRPGNTDLVPPSTPTYGPAQCLQLGVPQAHRAPPPRPSAKLQACDASSRAPSPAPAPPLPAAGRDRDRGDPRGLDSQAKPRRPRGRERDGAARPPCAKMAEAKGLPVAGRAAQRLCRALRPPPPSLPPRAAYRQLRAVSARAPADPRTGPWRKRGGDRRAARAEAGLHTRAVAEAKRARRCRQSPGRPGAPPIGARRGRPPQSAARGEGGAAETHAQSFRVDSCAVCILAAEIPWGLCA